LLVGLVLWVVAISLGAANGVFLLILIWITLGLWVALSKSS